MNSYLITGGAGFIGSHLADRLLSNPANTVKILDNLSRPGNQFHIEYLTKKYQNIKFIHADIRIDNATLESELKGIDCVFHLAGQVAVTKSVQNPREDFEINALGTFNILEACRKQDNQPIILFSSTNKVYGGIEGLNIIEGEKKYTYDTDLRAGISETYPMDFYSPYGCSKGVADQYIRDYSRIYGLRTIVFRQSCIYGHRQFGIEDQGWVAWFAIAALLGLPIKVYGSGKQVRDVLHVDDLVDAYICATNNIGVTSGKIYNIGGGIQNSLSILELMDILSDLYKKEIKFERDVWRPGDQKIYISNISKAVEDFGWTPKLDPRSGVEKLTQWAEGNQSILRSILNK